MSEKLDGIRAYWDGKQFLSKNDKVINVPESFKSLPPYPLDGVLWGGYEQSDLFTSLLKQNCGQKKSNLDWTKIKFCVFDAPHVVGTYDKRHLFLENNFPQYCNSNILLVPIQTCEGKGHLEKLLEEIINKGGEGIIIHHHDLIYHPGRTHNLLKVKKFFESVVTFLNVKPDSLNMICEQENGVSVFVKCTPAEYSSPPPVGTEITVKHQGFFAKSQKYKYPVWLKINPVKSQNDNNNMNQLKIKKKNVE
jgi:DNA ligase-1